MNPKELANQMNGWALDKAIQKATPYIIGIDEVGRGCIAGPVVTCAISLSSCAIEGLNDSKKLSAKKREKLFSIIKNYTHFIKIGIALTSEIDHMNIYQATLKAMERSIVDLPSFFTPHNTTILVDAMPLKKQGFIVSPIIKGDTKSPHIMAASVVAKVVRDHIMESYHLKYPQYHFSKHKGYATALHKKAIENHGALYIHRKSFAPISKIL